MDYVSPYVTGKPPQNFLDTYEDLEIAEIFANLFLQILILGTFWTTRRNKATIINNFWYSLSSTGAKGFEKFVCLTSGCNASISFLNGKLVKINGKASSEDSSIPSHKYKDCYHTTSESKQKLIESKLKDLAFTSGAAAIPKMFEDKTTALKKQGMSEKEIAEIMPEFSSYKS